MLRRETHVKILIQDKNFSQNNHAQDDHEDDEQFQFDFWQNYFFHGDFLMNSIPSIRPVPKPVLRAGASGLSWREMAVMRIWPITVRAGEFSTYARKLAICA